MSVETAEGEAGIVKQIDQLYLHIGTRKTGSTSIQDSLLRAKAALERRGVFVASPPGQPFRSLYTSFIAGTALWRETLQLAANKLVVSNGHSLVVTAEDYYHLTPEKAVELIDACKAVARNVTVVVFIRRQDQYVDSSYCQYVAAGHWVGNIQENFDRFIAQLSASMDYQKNIQFWTSLVGAQNLRVIPYANGDTAKVFLDLLGAGDLYDSKRAWRNARHPIDLLRASVLIGERIAAAKGLELHSFANLNRHFDFRSKVRSALSTALTGSGARTPAYSVLPEQAYRELAKRFSEANQKIAAQHGTEFSKDFTNFAPEPAKAYQDLGISHVAPENFGPIISVLTASMLAVNSPTR